MDARILIVDDHATVRESLRYVFSAAGMDRIMEANGSEQALRIMRDHEIELVLLDVMLRNNDDIDVFRKIHAVDGSIPVLIHSYYDDPRLLTRGFHLGAAGYVVKGRDKNALIQAIRQAAAGDTAWTSEQMARIHDLEADVGNVEPKRAT